MPLSRAQLEAIIEVFDLAIRPIRQLEGEQAMWEAIKKMRAEALDVASAVDRSWVSEQIEKVLAAHGLRPNIIH